MQAKEQHHALAVAIDQEDPDRWVVAGVSARATPEEAISEALQRCNKIRRNLHSGPCGIYSIDNERVWGSNARSTQPNPGARLLRVDSPVDVRSESVVGWLEVTGRAGNRSQHDLVLAIDVSDSVLASSGFDLDGDGSDGRTSASHLAQFGTTQEANFLRRRLKYSDYEDSVLRAEIRAAEAFIERLPLDMVRVAIIVFSDRAEVINLLTHDLAVLKRSLVQIESGIAKHLNGTNFKAAIETAVSLLAPSSGARSIVLLSDGIPTLPVNGAGARADAVGEAKSAARLGIVIHPFALGTVAEEGLAAYAEIAEITGGDVTHFAAPGDVIGGLRTLDLVGVESVSVVNETTGANSRALRLFPNGSFDAFIELAIGENRILIRAELDDGREIEIVRNVERNDPATFDDVARADAEAQRAELLERLNIHNLETQLWAESERIRRQRRRHLEIEVER